MSSVDPFDIDLSTVDLSDPEAVRVILRHLSNLVEAQHRQNLALKAENQKLKDEINRLKGEKGKPDIKSGSSAKDSQSFKKKKSRKKWKKQSKLDKVVIDKEKIVKYEGPLPDDACHKGYRSVVVSGYHYKNGKY